MGFYHPKKEGKGDLVNQTSLITVVLATQALYNLIWRIDKYLNNVHSILLILQRKSPGETDSSE